MRTGPQPAVVGLLEKPYPGMEGDHYIERVLGASAVGGGIGERPDDLELLDDRARPAVGDNHRQGIWMAGANLDEMNVQPIDLGHELRQGVEFRLAFAPIVICYPIARERLHRRQSHVLRLISDCLLLRPACRADALAEVNQRLFWNVDVERANGGRGFRGGGSRSIVSHQRQDGGGNAKHRNGHSRTESSSRDGYVSGFDSSFYFHK